MDTQQQAITVRELSKQYVIGGSPDYDNFREMVTSRLQLPWRVARRLIGKLPPENQEAQQAALFWALKDISFDIEPGQIVGVIGHNGAGKSTLLKVLTRITAPTRGEIRIAGRVASLLEVGTGFHPELTGRENIYLNGAILGMSRAEIKQKFAEIVAFAEVEKFLDTPVKRYSSGMYVRLAFAVAAHLDSDVLLVDEVLAVGDQAFQKRCLGKLDEVSKAGRTVFFVSHNLSSVARLCSRALVLDKGKLVFDGDIHDGIRFYTQQSSSIETLADGDYRGELYPTVRYDAFAINGQHMQQSVYADPFKPICIEVKAFSERDMSGFRATMSIRKDGQLLFSQYDGPDVAPLQAGEFQLQFQIPEYLLMPGEYSFSLGGYCADNGQWLWTPEYRFVVPEQWAEDYNSTSTVVGLINVRQFGQRHQG